MLCYVQAPILKPVKSDNPPTCRLRRTSNKFCVSLTSSGSKSPSFKALSHPQQPGLKTWDELHVRRSCLAWQEKINTPDPTNTARSCACLRGICANAHPMTDPQSPPWSFSHSSSVSAVPHSKTQPPHSKPTTTSWQQCRPSTSHHQASLGWKPPCRSTPASSPAYLLGSARWTA